MPEDPVYGQCGLRGLRDNCGPVGSKGQMGPVAPAFRNLHVKCPIFSGKDDEDAENHLLCSNDWKNSQGIAQDEKCGRLCLTLIGDSHIWYESITTLGSDCNKLQRPFHKQF